MPRRAKTPTAELQAQEYVLAPVADLTPHPDNPRVGDVDAIRESIRANRFYGACIVQRSTGYVLAGNHRLHAAKLEGVTELPVIYVDVDEDGAQRILLADNRTSELATNDIEKLGDLLRALDATDAGLVGTGYDDVDLKLLLAASGSAPAPTPVEDDDDVEVLLRLLVPRSVKRRFDAAWEECPGDDDGQRLAALLDRLR